MKLNDGNKNEITVEEKVIFVAILNMKPEITLVTVKITTFLMIGASLGIRKRPHKN
jgi:hypothetical protein